MVILSYPLQLDPSRRCLTSLVYALVGKRERHRQEQRQENQQQQDNAGVDERTEDMFERLADTSNHSNDPNDPTSVIDADEDMIEMLESFLFYGITCIFLVLSFSIAMVVSDLAVILGVVGATGSTMVSYVLPGKHKVVFCDWANGLNRIVSE